MPPDGSATLSQPDLFAPATLTTAISATSAPMTSKATRSTISSLASESGRLRSGWQDGQTIAPSPPDPAHASLSAAQAKAMGLLTSGIYGLHGTGSSASTALTRSLGSRLQTRVAGRGSTLYRLTWKLSRTPSRRSFFLLRASERPTSGIVSSGWPTPTRMASAANAGKTLTDAARCAGWPTPAAVDATSISESLASKRARGSGGINLNTAARTTTGWATPAARDYRTPNHKALKDRGGGAKGEQLNNQAAHLIPGASLNGLPASTAGAGLLNPDFSRWLLGIPATWPNCAPTATRSARKSPPK